MSFKIVILQCASSLFSVKRKLLLNSRIKYVELVYWVHLHFMEWLRLFCTRWLADKLDNVWWYFNVVISSATDFRGYKYKSGNKKCCVLYLATLKTGKQLSPLLPSGLFLEVSCHCSGKFLFILNCATFKRKTMKFTKNILKIIFLIIQILKIY